MIARSLALLGRHAMPLLVSGVVVGLLLPDLASLLRPLIVPLVFLLTTATLLRIDWPSVLVHARRPGRVALVLAWSLLVSPLVMTAAVKALGVPRGLADGLVLWAASSPLISAPAFAVLLGLDGALALVATMTATFLVPFTLPPLVLSLVGLELEIGVGELMLRLVVFVGGAVLLAAVLRRLLGKARLERSFMEVNGVNVLLLVLFGIGIMDGVRETLASRPGEALLFVLAAYAAAAGFHLLTALVFLGFGRRGALTVAVVSGNNNMAMAWANLGAAASPEIGLFFVAVQMPIYTLPAILKPIVRRLCRDGSPAPRNNPALTVAEPKQ